jgi:hypothetical protein
MIAAVFFYMKHNFLQRILLVMAREVFKCFNIRNSLDCGPLLSIIMYVVLLLVLSDK